MMMRSTTPLFTSISSFKYYFCTWVVTAVRSIIDLSYCFRKCTCCHIKKNAILYLKIRNGLGEEIKPLSIIPADRPFNNISQFEASMRPRDNFF
jgi:hypothetical protein